MTEIWTAVSATAVGCFALAYLRADGPDLGLALWAAWTPSNRSAGSAGAAIDLERSLWDADEVWLILAGGGVWVGFPDLVSQVSATAPAFIGVTAAGVVLRILGHDLRRTDSGRRPLWGAVHIVGAALIIVGLGALAGAAAAAAIARDAALQAEGALAGVVAMAAACLTLGASAALARRAAAGDRSKIDDDAWRRRAALAFAVTVWLVMASSVLAPMINEAARAAWFSGVGPALLAPIPATAVAASLWFAGSLRPRAVHGRALVHATTLLLATATAGLTVNAWPTLSAAGGSNESGDGFLGAAFAAAVAAVWLPRALKRLQRRRPWRALA